MTLKTTFLIAVTFKLLFAGNIRPYDDSLLTELLRIDTLSLHTLNCDFTQKKYPATEIQRSLLKIHQLQHADTLAQVYFTGLFFAYLLDIKNMTPEYLKLTAQHGVKPAVYGNCYTGIHFKQLDTPSNPFHKKALWNQLKINLDNACTEIDDPDPEWFFKDKFSPFLRYFSLYPDETEQKAIVLDKMNNFAKITKTNQDGTLTLKYFSGTITSQDLSKIDIFIQSFGDKIIPQSEHSQTNEVQ